MNLKQYRKAVADGSTVILIFKEKHGDRYFDVSTESRLFGACLSVLKERFDEGWWYEPPEGNEPEPPTLSLEEIGKLKEGRIKQEALEEHKSYNRDLVYFEEAARLYKNIKQAIDNKDGALAYQCLLARSNGEYERMELEFPEVIEHENHKGRTEASKVEGVGSKSN